MIGVLGNYNLNLKFGETEVPLDISLLRDFTIVQDMTQFLPTFRLKIEDAGGHVTHRIPFDKNLSKISVQISSSVAADFYNSFNFRGYKRQPVAEFGTSVVYDISGVLDKDYLFDPPYCRASEEGQTIKEFLEKMAIEELKCDETDVSPSLNYVKSIIQPWWSNIKLLRYLKSNLAGLQDNYAFQIFIKQRNGKSIFVCRSLKELISGPEIARFAISDIQFEDFYPVFDYKIYDDFMMLSAFGGETLDYKYFNDVTGEVVEEEATLDYFYSLTDYFGIDAEDKFSRSLLTWPGRSNQFTEDFKGRAYAKYYERIFGLVKMSILTWGIINMCPGDVIFLIFPQSALEGGSSYVYAGYWVVRQVKHMFGKTHRTKLFLTRNGMDTGEMTSLVKAPNKRTM